MRNLAGEVDVFQAVQSAIAADPTDFSDPTGIRSESRPLRGALTRPLRVIIVEDEAFIRLDLEDGLSRAGHQVVATAVEADDAISVVDRERPDVVLMDIRILGPRDGVEAALEIRRRFDIPCIMISAFVDAAAQQRLAPARPHAFVSKPIDFLSLQRALDGL